VASRWDLRANAPIAADQGTGLHALDGCDRRPRDAHRAKHLPRGAAGRQTNRDEREAKDRFHRQRLYASARWLSKALRGHSGTLAPPVRPRHAMPYKEVAMNRLASLRLAGAMLILGATFVGASILHGLHANPCSGSCRARIGPPPALRPRWADPAALAGLMIGMAGAAGAVLVMRRRSDA